MGREIVLASVNAKAALYAATADEFSAIAPNIHLGMLAAYLKSLGLPVRVIDCEPEGVTMNQLAEIIARDVPTMFGVICTGANPSSSTMTMAGVVKFFNESWKEIPGTTTFIWGPHPTVLPELTLKQTGVDYIVRGEGFETIPRLYQSMTTDSKELSSIPGLAYFAGGEYHQTVEPPLFKDMSDLPPIDYDVMKPSGYRAHNWHCFGDMENRSPYMIVWTSFGCPFSCSFCCVNNLFFGKRIQRFRKIELAVDEISLLYEKYGVRNFRIFDELFVVRQDRVDEFCDRLEAKGYPDLNMWCYAREDTVTKQILNRLRKVGMNWISYGFESANPAVMAALKKGSGGNTDSVIRMTQDAGLSICADVMFGAPGEDMDAMKRTYDFLTHYNFEWGNMYPFFAYPGTQYFDPATPPKSWDTYSLYGYECAPAGTEFLTPAQVLKFRDDSFINYHSRPEYLEMIERKFGNDTRAHIERMTAVPLRRKIVEDELS